jgi:hypothetical protein
MLQDSIKQKIKGFDDLREIARGVNFVKVLNFANVIAYHLRVSKHRSLLCAMTQQD